MTYQWLADLVLTLHSGIVVFVVGGLVLIVVGNLRGWNWVNAGWFRVAHLAAIGFVVLESWIGMTCPLTTLEAWLREQAHEPTYAGSFIEHWLQRLIFYDAPTWVFTLAYTLFALAAVLTWWRFPPRWSSTGRTLPRRRQQS
jgi:uncharacterized protein DUF2784